MPTEGNPLELVDVTGDAAGESDAAAAPHPPPPPLLSTKALLGDVLAELGRRNQKRRAGQWVGGMRTGIKLLDKHLKGLSPGRLTVLNATTGIGKSTFGNQLAYQVAAFEGQDACALYVSFENDPFELILKLLARLSGWPIDSLEDGNVPLDDARLQKAAQRIAATPIYYLRGNAATSVAWIAKQIAAVREESGRADLLLVYDYLQMGARFLPGQTTTEKVDLMCAYLLGLAEHAQVHVWAIGSQNREANKASESTLHGGRGSGIIEYDANHLLAMTGKEDEPRHLKILKNRHGHAGGDDRFILHGDRGYFEQAGDDGDRWAI
jgi:replicative DNA helicase